MSAKDQVSSAIDASIGTTALKSTPASVSLSETDTAVTWSSQSAKDSDAEGGNASDIQTRIEQKRLEHEKQRAMHQKAFEQQMALLEKQQRQEEQTLLQKRQSGNDAGAGVAAAAASAASAPTTPPNEALSAAHPKALATALQATDASDPAARAKMPSSRRQSGEKERSADDLTSAVGAMSMADKASADATAAKTSDAAKDNKGENLTPVFNERFLFDDELDNEDSDFVNKYNLKGDQGQFPLLVQRDTASARDADWPKFGGAAVDAAVPTPSAAADTTSSSLRRPLSSKSPPPQGTPNVAASFGSSAGRQASTLPLPSPSPRLSQTGRSSPAIKAATLAGVASRQASGPGSPSPGLGGLGGEVGRSGAGSRFVNTALSIPAATAAAAAAAAAANLNKIGPAGGGGTTAGGAAAFPSFNLGAFSGAGASTGSESPSRFGPYSPSSFNADAARRGSRPSSGFFDAFNPTAGANAPGSLFPTDKYSMGMVGADDHAKLGGPGTHTGGGSAAANAALAKNARKAELEATTQLEDLQGDIFALCKDQHGCRFLQKKLEESMPAHRDMIFSETFTHFAELMTDPFGNYLCQKMLEYCTDEQRNLIVELVAPELVTISLNMHGTRAVQKMIDFLSTRRQIHSIIVALSMNVVTLIKDLNGNHVVQKCLNRLGAEDNQFIYNAVAAHCVEVATHRHGCCVLQRCIDHASESQRVQLVAEITYNALTLVQDPFGNYVVQYVLDLSIPRFTDAVVRQFVGNVCLLSVQKFSSNVIEKCIRVSEPGVRKQLIEELLNRTRLEKLLRDSFANYVVQTSLDYADAVQRMRLVECIRPILPVIRNTPYGKRIQSKLQRDNLDLGPPNGVPYSVLHAAHQQQLHAMAAMAGHRGGAGNPAYMGMNAYGPQGHAMPPPPPPPPPPHMNPYQQYPQPQPAHMYGGGGVAAGGGGAAAAGSGQMRAPPHNLPPHNLAPHNLAPPNFAAPAYAGGFGGGGNLPPPMGMQPGGGRSASSGSLANAGAGGFGSY
ncbi:uncharacterized protein UHO2_04163 [Ustilago hordei]|uniref:PUM-HD domain-containing protein n=1 Tax=Ustilago hordei TaxID=120017 RepID=I2FWQ1_USTHO|nr:uncharacterized protein UHO2_04163 [Ustilago hordei]CCF51344.1 uncharacterized protein UHOR_05267 [Ustilago hordei]SYW79520.1 related to PUF4 - member of the PUF protein family [Ustilago hordei]